MRIQLDQNSNLNVYNFKIRILPKKYMQGKNRQPIIIQKQGIAGNKEPAQQNMVLDYYQNKARINLYTYPSSETNRTRIIILFFFRSLFIGNILIIFLLINQRSSIQAKKLVVSHFLQKSTTYIQLISSLLSIWTIICFFYINRNKETSKIGESSFVSMLQYVIQLNLQLSGLLMQINIVPNFIFFIVSACFVFYSAIHYQNYIVKQDYMYQSSIISNILYYLLVTATYTSNSAALYLQNQIIFFSIACLGSFFMIYWYLSCGKTLFIYLLSRNLLIMIVSLSIVPGLLAAECYLYENFDLNMKISCKILLMLSIVFMSLKILEDRQFQTEMAAIFAQNPQQVIRFQLVARVLRQKLSLRQFQLIIKGTIKLYMQKNQCLQQISMVEKKFSNKQLISLKTSSEVILSEFTRSKYEASYQKDPNVQLGLKYCEFMINQSPIQSILAQRLEELSLKPLSWFQRYQLNKMKLALEEKVAKINANIFEGKVDIQNIILYQNQFGIIEHKLKDYLFQNVSLWKMLLEDQLNMSLIKQLFTSIFKLIREMDKGWEFLSKYFSINRGWKYLYASYVLYIKNAKIAVRLIDQFKGSMGIHRIFKQEKIYFDKMATAKEISLSRRLLFDSETSVFHACIEHGQLFIKRVSQYFTKNLKYESSQIIGANLSTILPNDLRQNHMQKVLSWINEGYQTNQQAYEIKMSHCIGKDGQEIPTLKLFKTFVNYFMHSIQYVCLIKVNKKVSDQGRRKTRATSLHDSSQDIQKSNINKELNFQKQQSDLSHQNNIFIKEECFMPVQELKQLKDIKIVVRLYAFIITISVAILALLNNNSSNQLVLYSSQYINFMQIYRLPFVIANSFHMQVLGIGDLTITKTRVAKNVQFLRNIQSNRLTLQTIFDGTINKPALYYPAHASNVNKNTSYNQVELFHFIISQIVTLAYADYIGPNDRDFKLLNDYLKPGYDNLFNMTKMEFHKVFQRNINRIHQSFNATIQIQTGVLFFFLAISLYKVINFFKRIKSIVVSISQFSTGDMNMIYIYWCKTFLIFQSLIFKNRCIESEDIKAYNLFRKGQLGLKSLKSQDLLSQDMNINSHQRFIESNKQAVRFKIKIFLLISVAIVFSFIIVVSIQASFISELANIYQFQNDGFSFLQYYPTAAIVAVGCFQSTLSAKYPNAFNFESSLYDDVVSNLWLVGNFKYIGQIKDSSSLYYTKQRIYFFENPCQYNPRVAINAGLSQDQCQKIAQSSFKRGLTSYMRLAYTQSSGPIRGTRQMSDKQLEQFSKSVTLLSAYILDAIVTWGNEFNTRIISLVAKFFYSTIFEVALIFGVHIFIFELLILRELRKQYQFYRLLYLNMVPQHILVKDKIIKQKFIRNKIIELS